MLSVDTKGAEKWKGYNGYEAIKVLKALSEGERVAEYQFTSLDVCTEKNIGKCYV